jgi:hypothetical protein
MIIYPLVSTTAMASLIGSTGLTTGAMFGMSTAANKIQVSQNQKICLLTLTTGQARRLARSAPFPGSIQRARQLAKVYASFFKKKRFF